jgi:hypothetical protein
VARISSSTVDISKTTSCFDDFIESQSKRVQFGAFVCAIIAVLSKTSEHTQSREPFITRSYFAAVAGRLIRGSKSAHIPSLIPLGNRGHQSFNAHASSTSLQVPVGKCQVPINNSTKVFSQ